MSELTLNAIQLGLLVLLWAFVFSVVGALRSDLYGTRVVARTGMLGKGSRGKSRRRNSKRDNPSELAVVAGSMKGTAVPLASGGLLIGRNPECSLVLSDDFASGRHLRIVPDESGDWFAEDLGSTNGTFVDNQRISASTRLNPGSQIRIGQTVLELRR